MTMNNQGRPTAPGTIEANELPTISGDRGLDHEEALIFELGRKGMTGVDLPDVQMSETRLGGQRRKGPIGLPGLSEPEVVRHYVRLSRHELCDRCGALSARLLHDEAQSAPEREDGAAAGLRRSASARAAIDDAGRARADLRSDEMAHHAHRHAGGRDVAEGRRAWRAVRPARDPRRHRGARREAPAHPGAGIRARHQSGDGRVRRLHGR